MNSITKAEYIQRVMLIMNEASMFDTQGNTFAGADSAQVDRYIEGSYVDAWRRCAGVLPKAWFKNASFKHYPIISNTSQGTGYVILPSDFYLMNSFKMLGWKKAVYESSVENERTSAIQSNEFTRGSQIRPVCTASSREVSDVANNIIVVGSMAIPVFYPFDNGPVFCSINNKTYALIDEILSYKGLHSATDEYVANDVVYANATLYRAEGSISASAFNPLSWTVMDYASDPAEALTIGMQYKDYYDGKYYACTAANKVVELELTIGINQVLNYYSLQKGLASHTIEEAIYIPAAKPLSSYGDDDDLGLDQRVIEPMAYLGASTVFVILEKYDIAKTFEARVVEMFPGFKSIKGNNVTIKQ